VLSSRTLQRDAVEPHNVAHKATPLEGKSPDPRPTTRSKIKAKLLKRRDRDKRRFQGVLRVASEGGEGFYSSGLLVLVLTPQYRLFGQDGGAASPL